MKWRALCAVVALAAAVGCGNDSGVTTGATPTPTTPTPTPTATGTPSGVYQLAVASANPLVCNSNTVVESFGVSSVQIDMSSGAFTPNWTFLNDPGYAVVDAPHGTVTGNDFSAGWTDCYFDGAITTKHTWTWTGTLSGDRTTFTSTMSETLTNQSGDALASCASVSANMTDCTSPGLSWQINGNEI